MKRSDDMDELIAAFASRPKDADPREDIKQLHQRISKLESENTALRDKVARLQNTGAVGGDNRRTRRAAAAKKRKGR